MTNLLVDCHDHQTVWVRAFDLPLQRRHRRPEDKPCGIAQGFSFTLLALFVRSSRLWLSVADETHELTPRSRIVAKKTGPIAGTVTVDIPESDVHRTFWLAYPPREALRAIHLRNSRSTRNEPDLLSWLSQWDISVLRPHALSTWPAGL